MRPDLDLIWQGVHGWERHVLLLYRKGVYITGLPFARYL